MPAPALIADIAPTVFTRAGVAYVHYLSFMLCFGALVLERRLIQPNPNRKDATLMVITDVVYGMAALALLVSGILRVCLLYTSPSPRDRQKSRMPSSA